MADVKNSQETNHVIDFTNKPRWHVADDPTGTPVDGYMNTDDIATIADTQAAAAIAALGTLGDVVKSGASTADNLASFVDSGNEIQDSGIAASDVIDALATYVVTNGAITDGHVAVFDTDTRHLKDGGAPTGGTSGGRSVRTITASDSALITDDMVVCDKATAMTFNLLAASGSGKPITVCSINTGLVTIQITGGVGTIDALTTYTLNQWNSVDLVDISAGMWKVV